MLESDPLAGRPNETAEVVDNFRRPIDSGVPVGRYPVKHDSGTVPFLPPTMNTPLSVSTLRAQCGLILTIIPHRPTGRQTAETRCRLKVPPNRSPVVRMLTFSCVTALWLQIRPTLVLPLRRLEPMLVSLGNAVSPPWTPGLYLCSVVRLLDNNAHRQSVPDRCLLM